jgi:lysophospholipase L1-like esterase
MTWRKLGLILAAGCLVVAGLEGATRLLFESNTVFNMTIGGFRRHHPTRGSQLTPGYRAGDIAINSLGFLGPEFDVARRPGTVRILFIGNSVTFRPPGRNYARVVEDILRNVHGDVAVEAIVGAVPGYSSSQALDWYQETLGDLKPDITVINLGWNDMAQFHPFGLRYKNEGLYREPSAIGKAMMHLHFLRIPYYFLGRRERAKPIDLSPLTPEEEETLQAFTPTLYSQNLTELVTRSRSDGSTVFLVSLSSLLTHAPEADDLAIMHFPRGLHRKLAVYQGIYHQYSATLEGVAHSTDTPVIDMTDLVGDPATRRDIFTDTMHINEEGAERYGRIIADRLAPVVDSLVRERAAPAR